MRLSELLQKSNNTFVKLYLKESGRIRTEYEGQYDRLFFFKTFLKWYRSQVSDKTPLTDRRPWLTEKAIQFLEDIITPGMRVLEYGCGGSTLFFLDRGCKVTSVEHNTDWLEAVKDSLKKNEAERWSHYLVTQKNDAKSFAKEYSSAPFKNEPTFDVILIDGKCRDHCFNTIQKTGYKGWVIYDNTDQWVSSNELRPFSKNVFKQFAGPTCYAMPFTETTIMKL